MVEFLRENVFYKFGYPKELVIDQGSQFTSNMIEELLSHHKIKHSTSTPYHLQANGQVELTNKALKSILTMVVSSSRKDWAITYSGLVSVMRPIDTCGFTGPQEKLCKEIGGLESLRRTYTMSVQSVSSIV